MILQDLQCKEVSENEIKSGGHRAKFEEKRGSKRALFHLSPPKQRIRKAEKRSGCNAIFQY